MEINECKKLCHRNYHGKVRKVIDAQIDKFFEIEKLNFQLPKHKYKVGDNVMLNTCHYLHGVGKNDKAINFVSKFFHSSIEKANKQPSKPLVIMNFSPISSLNFAGIINLPLASRECSYSPINNGYISSHFSTTLFHFSPLHLNFNI